MTHWPILAGSVPDEGQTGRGVTTSDPAGWAGPRSDPGKDRVQGPSPEPRRSQKLISGNPPGDLCHPRDLGKAS